MAQDTVFGGVIVFLEKLGVYDVILPFLLVFTIVFAIFERTKIFGTEEVDGEKIPKKNLNAMVAFVVGFLVVASSKVVAVIDESLPNFVLLLLVAVCFLVLVGTFFSEEEDVMLEGGWRTFFMIVMFIGIVLIFMNAIKTDAGVSWLALVINYLRYSFGSTAVSSLVLIIVVLLFMMYVVKDPKPSKSKKQEDHSE